MHEGSVRIPIDVTSSSFDSNEKDYSIKEIKSLDSSLLEYDYFFKEHMQHNLPCIIKNISSSWKCTQHWIKDETINCGYFIKHYGDIEAPVADCDRINYNAQCKCDMKVKDYMSYLESPNKDKLLYLKDWHLKRLRPNEKFYEVPKIFASDWLNEFAIDNNDDDFMFVYIGAKDTWTPFHADVYTSYSWSVNIVGRKKWILFPPGEEEKVKDSLGNMPVLFNSDNYKNIKYFEVIQEKGEGIFVPSGWHHQVFNLLDTISINHNFINACNIEIVWEALQQNLVAVEHEIEEFRDTSEFFSQCQLILKSVFGMDIECFIKLIMHIAQKRLNYFKGTEQLLFNIYFLQKNHVLLDLHTLSRIISLIQNHHMFLKNLPSNIAENLTGTYSAIAKVLQ